MSRHKRKYMVGFDSDAQTVYGRPEKTDLGHLSDARFADPMTLSEATRYVNQLRASRNRTACIYELVPVRACTIGREGVVEP